MYSLQLLSIGFCNIGSVRRRQQLRIDETTFVETVKQRQQLKVSCEIQNTFSMMKVKSYNARTKVGKCSQLMITVYFIKSRLVIVDQIAEHETTIPQVLSSNLTSNKLFVRWNRMWETRIRTLEVRMVRVNVATEPYLPGQQLLLWRNFAN